MDRYRIAAGTAYFLFYVDKASTFRLMVTPPFGNSSIDCIVEFVTFCLVSRFLFFPTQKIRPLQLSKALALEDQCDQQAQY